MDREVCGVCGAWKGDDELIALRQDLAAASARIERSAEWLIAKARTTGLSERHLRDTMSGTANYLLTGDGASTLSDSALGESMICYPNHIEPCPHRAQLQAALAAARALLAEARDNAYAYASIAEEGISQMRYEYRKELVARIDAVLKESE